jgi:hypothetical protein
MALNKNIEITATSFLRYKGLQLQNGEATISGMAYIKVSSVAGNKETTSCEVSFTLPNDITWSESYTFTPNMDGDNFIKQAYQHLKTLPEFADATDV